MPYRRVRGGKTEILGAVRVGGGKKKVRKCASWEEAIAWENQTREEHQASVPNDTIVLSALFRRYLESVQARGISVGSYRDKKSIFKQFCDFAGGSRRARSVRYAEVEEFLNRIASEVSGARANRYRVHLIAAWNWGARAVGLDYHCPWRVAKYKESKSPRYIPSVEDFWAVHDAAQGGYRRLLLTMLHTAGRKGEVLDLQWRRKEKRKDWGSDVDFVNKRVRLFTGKRSGGREADWIPMTAELERVLRAQQIETGFGPYVFVSPVTGSRIPDGTKLMHRLCEKAGVKRFGFHAIRHLTASILDDAGVPLGTIQGILRHKNAMTTALYLHSLRGVRAEIGSVLSREKPEGKVVKIANHKEQI